MTPEGWRRSPVSALGEVAAGKAKNANGDGPSRPYLRVANVFDGRIDVSDVLQMPFSDQEFARYELRRGDVLLNEGQSLDLVGRCAMYRDEYEEPCAIQNALIRFRAGTEVIPDYVEQLFRWCQRSGVFAEIATQTTSIAHLGVSRFGQLEIPVPPLGEQKKIAAILSSVDEATEATQAVIDQLQVVKKAMMSELLTRGLPGRHTRFKQTEIGEVPEDWTIVGILDAVDLPSGQVDPRGEPYRDLPLVAPNHIEGQTGRLLGLESAAAQGAISGKYVVAAGDVVYSKIRPYLRKAWLADRPALCSADMYPLRPRRAVDPSFLLLTVLGERFSAFAESVSMRTGIPKINREELATYALALPPLEEQRQIGEFHEVLARRIEAEHATLGAQKQTKHVLMSVLLTGEVRVKPDEGA